MEDTITEDHEGGFACLCGFRFAPSAEIFCEDFLFGGVDGLFALYLQSCFGGFWADCVAGSFSLRRGGCGHLIEEEVWREWTCEGSAFVGEGGFFVVDHRAFRVGEGVSDDLDETGTCQGVEVGVELFAFDTES